MSRSVLRWTRGRSKESKKSPEMGQWVKRTENERTGVELDTFEMNERADAPAFF